MIEIDLLPLELRKKKKISLEEIFKMRFSSFLLLGCIILFHFLLQTLSAINTNRLNRLQRNWQDLSFQRAKIEQLKGEISQIDEKVDLIAQLMNKRILWSKKMNQISNLLIGGVWLSEITLEQRKLAEDKPAQCLIIRGSAASRTKDEPALIGRFMQNLKNEPSFSDDFAEIELGPIKNRQILQTEIMDFILICRFKPDRVEALHK